MNKTILSILFTLLVSVSFSQYLCFEEIHPVQGTPGNDFTEVSNSPYPTQSFLKDFNMDGYTDVLLVGSPINNPSSQGTNFYFYINDGNGQFSLDPGNQFYDFQYQFRIAGISDIDGDLDEDILILCDQQNKSFLYRNDGLGNFSQVIGSIFESIYLFPLDKVSEPVFVDVDDDSDNDVFVGSRLFMNDGTGNFSESTGLSDISPVLMPETSLFDADNDGDLDAVVCGKDSLSTNTITRLYLNDGNGNFSISSGTSFIEVLDGDLDHSDIDNDGDQDVLITGINTNIHNSQSNLYRNDGAGNFTIVSGTPFLPSSLGKILFTDINNDGSEDVLITGGNFNDTMSTNFPPCYTKYYTNDGNGNFNLLSGTPFIGVFGSVSVSDLNGDNLKETLIAGQYVLNNSYFAVFVNIYDFQFCSTPPSTLHVNTFSTPSDINGCTGTVYITAQEIPDYTFDLQNGSPIITSTSGQVTKNNLCPGVYSMFSTNGIGDTLTSVFVIPTDSTYILNDPFSSATPILDELSITLENCDIDYATISDAYIDSVVLILPDTLLVDWAIVDANDTTIVPAIYILSGGSGNYYLQLDLYCSQKSVDQFFVVTEGVGFNNGTISLLGVKQNDALSIALMPNPTSGLVTIRLNNDESAQLNVLDLQGKIILSKQIKNNEQIALDALSTGTYLFDISSKNGNSITRVVKY
nr:T9SS type A sorting domain-containing protein [uncultured Fluviicola sp.]